MKLLWLHHAAAIDSSGPASLLLVVWLVTDQQLQLSCAALHIRVSSECPAQESGVLASNELNSRQTFASLPAHLQSVLDVKLRCETK